MSELIQRLKLVGRVRDAITQLTVFAQRYSDPLDFVVSERKLKVETIKNAGIFIIHNNLLFNTLFNEIVPDDIKKLTGIVNKEGFMHSGRYVIPLFDQMGRVMTWQSWNKSKLKKYLTSKAYGFVESATFFGMDNFNTILKRDWAIVLEGNFDKIRLNEEGYDNVLACMTNELSFYKRQILNRVKKVIFIPDTDKAGKLSSHMNPGDLPDIKLWKTDRDFVRLELPTAYKDVDNFIKEDPKNAETLKKYIDISLKARSRSIIKIQ